MVPIAGPLGRKPRTPPLTRKRVLLMSMSTDCPGEPGASNEAVVPVVVSKSETIALRNTTGL